MIECITLSVASATGRELEGVNGKWKVMIVWVVDKEPVDDIFLKAFGFVAFGNFGTSFTSCFTFFDACCLGEDIVIHFNVVDDNSPFSVGVDCTKWSDVSCF